MKGQDYSHGHFVSKTVDSNLSDGQRTGTFGRLSRRGVEHLRAVLPQLATRSNRRAISCFGCTPTSRSTSRPRCIIRRVGMPVTPKREAVAGFSSTFNFANRTRLENCIASSSMIGASVRQGPHHAAHISTSTGSSERSTSAANVASDTSTGRAGTGSRARHFPQTGASPLATFCWSRRFICPHAGQRMRFGSACMAGLPQGRAELLSLWCSTRFVRMSPRSLSIFRLQSSGSARRRRWRSILSAPEGSRAGSAHRRPSWR